MKKEIKMNKYRKKIRKIKENKENSVCVVLAEFRCFAFVCVE